jgi:hypothetical protein
MFLGDRSFAVTDDAAACVVDEAADCVIETGAAVEVTGAAAGVAATVTTGCAVEVKGNRLFAAAPVTEPGPALAAGVDTAAMLRAVVVSARKDTARAAESTRMTMIFFIFL